MGNKRPSRREMRQKQRLFDVAAKTIKEFTESTEDGEFKVQFRFDGVVYTRVHTLNAFECKKMIETVKIGGDGAANEIVWKMASVGLKNMVEGVLGQVGADCVKKYFIPRVQEVLNESSNTGTTASDSPKCDGKSSDASGKSSESTVGEGSNDAESPEGKPSSSNYLS